MSAVMLKPAQVANKERDLKKNVLQAAGMYDESLSVEEQFERFNIKIVDLETGKFTHEISNVATYDQVKAAKDAQLSDELSDSEDIAKISRREKYAKVYTLEGDDGIEQVILPIRGYGLWGTLYGFLALEADGNTVVGLGYYDHKETPGLGGEVDNPNWKALWHGKKIYDDSGDVSLSVIKGQVDTQSDPNAEHKVDGLSGATLTSRGVQNMVRFWLGENGYAKFLDNLRNGEV
jgi:Na+-transporting NADH:ubiquinone oxidoreductase subunit C